MGPALADALQPWLEQVLGEQAAGAAWRGSDECVRALAAFEEGSQGPALFIHADEAGHPQLATVLPIGSSGQALYVVHAEQNVANSSYQLGLLDRADPLQSMLQLVGGLHLPCLLGACSAAWPEQLRQDLAGQAQAFMAQLAEMAHARRGRTLLYVPQEQLPAGGEACSGEVLQRLEGTLLRWTRQVRDLLLEGQGGEGSRGEGGPLGELQFWRLRSADLGAVSVQLDDAALRRVLGALEAAKSPYLPAFLALRGSIQAEASKAASNLRFLAVLEEPCGRLAAATAAAQVAEALPGMLDAVRVVWALSPHFNTPEQLTALLRKVSKEVIARCCASLSLGAIFSGQDLAQQEQRLRQCLQTAAAWRAAYEQAAGCASASLPSRPWTFPQPAIFAHVDAFAQRCDDLLEVCAAQRQFGCELPASVALGGPKAAEVKKAVAEVQASFAQLMSRLQRLQYNPLDVRVSAWFEDMAGLRAAARDLELMLGNVAHTAAAAAPTLAARLDVLAEFAAVATRDGFRKCLEGEMAEWHQQFVGELGAVKQLFEGLKTQLPAGALLPSYAGRAALLRSLLRRIEASWDQLQALAPHLPTVPQAAESTAAYEALHAGLQQWRNQLNTEWFGGVAPTLEARLQDNLLRQDKAGGGLLAVNLAPELAVALEEARLFENTRLGVPPAALTLLEHRSRLRSLQVCMASVARDYNAILGGLAKEERRLFKDRLRALDRRVLPGVNKLSWASPRHQTDFFYKDATRACRDTAAAAEALHAASGAVEHLCALVRSTQLVRVDRRRLCLLSEFAQRQGTHQAEVRARLAAAHAELSATLVMLYGRFSADSEEVQREWLGFLRRSDQALQDALAATARRSLQDLCRALGGDSKGSTAAAASGGRGEVPPIFTLSVVLDADSGRVELSPTLQQLFDTVSGAARGGVAVLEGVPRLTEEFLAGCAAKHTSISSLLSEAETLPPFLELVTQNEEAVGKPLQNITTAITGIVETVQQLLNYLERRFKVIWDNEISAYLRRCERSGRPPAAFEADIAKYRKLQEEVLGEDSTAAARFLSLDLAPLKQALVARCEAWRTQLTALLASLAGRQLAALHEDLAAGAQGLSALGSPASAEAAGELEALLGRLQGERQELEGRVGLCEEQCSALERLQASLGEEEQAALERLPGAWTTFARALEAAPARLQTWHDQQQEA